MSRNIEWHLYTPIPPSAHAAGHARNRDWHFHLSSPFNTYSQPPLQCPRLSFAERPMWDLHPAVCTARVPNLDQLREILPRHPRVRRSLQGGREKAGARLEFKMSRVLLFVPLFH